MESAQNVTDLISTISIENEVDTTTDVTQCAVCGDSMHHSKWYNHIGSQHNYLAWRCGDPTLVTLLAIVFFNCLYLWFPMKLTN